MGVIVKLAPNQFIYWSTVCDAPLTEAMTRDDMVEWQLVFGRARNAEEVLERIERANVNGTSYIDGPPGAERFLKFNRAGPNESCLTFDEIKKACKVDE